MTIVFSEESPLSAPMNGLNLVEASAGTGKTFTIAGLYLRLVVEARIAVENILVVTYTKAATAELRERLRARLVQAWRAACSGAAPADEQLQAMLATTADRDGLRRQLEAALASFDIAAIYTIHGFCQRVLADSAFEAGLATGSELLPDVDDLVDEIVADYWREKLYAAPAAVVRHIVLSAKLGPEALRDLVKRYAGRTELTLRAPAPPPALDAILTRYDEAYRAAQTTWRETQSQVEDILLHAKVFNRNKLRVKAMERLIRALERYFAATSAPPPLPMDEAQRITRATLTAALKSGQELPEHAFFTMWDRVVDAALRMDAALQAMTAVFKYDLLVFAQAQLLERKRHARQQSYDDLITLLHAALHGRSGAGLAAKVREQYHAALIDEFQDTDRIQYEIFARCFAGRDAPVYFVGDPKQAIYSFRGADVIAYVDAARACPNRFSLRTNWRSDATLVDGVNALFSGPAPFFLEGIDYQPVNAARDGSVLRLDGDDGRALRLWFLGPDTDGKLRSKQAASSIIATATANEIVRLLDQGRRGLATLGDKALDGGDIAVLVRSHSQGAVVQEALRHAGVATVRYGHDNVFHTAEARELERVLIAIAEPSNEALLRSALATSLFGVSGNALAALEEDERGWVQWLETFQHYHALWQAHGFVAMAREMFGRAHVATRILALPEGERRLTNLDHLVELLQAEGSMHHRGPAALVKWFSGRREKKVGTGDEVLLRLESDARVVKIVTVHAAKGLEYPIVFCPFVWEGLAEHRRDSGALVYHERDAQRTAVLDVSESAGPMHAWAREEEFAEALRLFYVALTRAKHRCYVVHGMIKGVDSAPLAWLLYHDRFDRQASPTAPITQLKQLVDERPVAAVRDDLLSLTQRAPQALVFEELNTEVEAVVAHKVETTPVLDAARRFTGRIDATWRVTSFSSLTAAAESELPDHDAMPGMDAAVVETVAQTPAKLTIFDFPRGARPGTCLHHVFETWDFSCHDPGLLRDHVRTILAGEGFADQWVEPVAEMVQSVLATSLTEASNEERDAADAVRLNTVALGRRINELEFYFPVQTLNVAGLMRVLQREGFWDSAGLTPVRDQFVSERIRGYLHGFVDLVFECGGRYYIVDYKSNWLGADYEAYDPAAVAQAMVDHDYYLQFLLYTVALHRYLRRRVPGYDYQRHFGGVRYLFIRGMNPRFGCSRGVYAYTPPMRVVEVLEVFLSSEERRGYDA